MTVAEIHQAQASERERILFQSHGVIVANGERVFAGHLGAVRCTVFRRRVRLAGWRLAFYSVGVT